MALTMTRWLGAVSVICALIAIDGKTRQASRSAAPAPPADSVRLRDLQRRVGDASLRWEALVRRDAALARLKPAAIAVLTAPTIILDPLLPDTHRSILERAILRHWASLGIDSARIPVTVAVVIDTAISIDRLSAGRGQVAYDYLLPTADTRAGDAQCVAIIGLQSRVIVRPGAQRALTEAVAAPLGAAALIGPCAFAARFGAPGPEIDRWLRARSYRVAASPQWWSLPQTSAAISERWQHANAEPLANAMYTLSPRARGCAAGHTEQCAGSLAAGDTLAPGELLMMQRARDPHWGQLTGRYLSDLATALGPERFQRFWQSDLTPDAALRAVASTSLDVWTHQWAVGLVGAQRVGPALSLVELVGKLSLAGVALALASWGWGRRQVR